MQNKTTIYLDHAATTRLSSSALKAMLPYLQEQYGNPSGLYWLAQEAKAGVESARGQVAKAIGVTTKDLLFTSGGTESNNWAIAMGAKYGEQNNKKHIITSSIEHHAVLHPMQTLQRQGFDVTFLPVSTDGFVRPEQLEEAIRPDTAFVSIMAVNNEVGTIQPIAQIGEICRAHNILLHCDAVQALGKIPIDVQQWQVDFLSLSAHKVNGPKGVGALYLKNPKKATSFLEGGGQEKGLRAGTENVASIVGFGVSAQQAAQRIEERKKALQPMGEALRNGLLEISDVTLNGSQDNRLIENVNVAIAGVESEMLLVLLDQEGIAASAGSACSSGSLDPSHVLLAMGQSPELAKCSLRLTLGEENTMEEIQQTLTTINRLVNQLRA